MLTLARLFASLLFGAVLLVGSGIASMADVAGHHLAVEKSWVDAPSDAQLAELRATNPVDCDGKAGKTCCAQTCGSASCPIGAFSLSAAHVFAAPPRVAFSEAQDRLLTQRTRFSLLRPPRSADFI